MTTRQFEESVNAEIRRMTNKAKPERFVDYNVYPPSATSDRKGWAVTIGGQYIEGKRFECRADAEAFARSQCDQQGKTQ